MFADCSANVAFIETAGPLACDLLEAVAEVWGSVVRNRRGRLIRADPYLGAAAPGRRPAPKGPADMPTPEQLRAEAEAFNAGLQQQQQKQQGTPAAPPPQSYGAIVSDGGVADPSAAEGVTVEPPLCG